MITRSITRPVTSPIARGINAAFAVWNPRALFALGEHGVIYDPSDLSTLWQDSAGTTPVTAAGQPVGLMLDKRLGLLVRGPELVVNGEFGEGTTGWLPAVGAILSVVNGALRVTNGTATYGFAYQSISTVPGAMYQIRPFKTGGSPAQSLNYHLGSVAGSTSIIANADASKPLVFKAVGTSTVISIYGGGDLVGNYTDYDNISIRELPGNHAFQPTASAKPFVRDTPRRIDYDADDSLGITFPVSLGAACTVARSIPGVGAQILTAQTIGTSFSDTVDNCALIIIDRALTASETSALTIWLNRRAGV